MDGVLLDSIGVIRDDMKNRYKGITEDDFKAIFLENFWEGIKKFKETAHIKYDIDKKTGKYPVRNNDIPLFHGAKEMLESLSEKYKLVINSSEYHENIIKRLERNNVLHIFDFIGGKEVSENKIEKFGIILERFGVSSEEVIFITDTIGDISESDKAGIESIAVTWGVHSREDFKKQSFSAMVLVLDDLADITRLLGESSGPDKGSEFHVEFPAMS